MTYPIHPAMRGAKLCGHCGIRQIGIERKTAGERVRCCFCESVGPWATVGDGTWAGARNAIVAWNLANADRA